MRFNFVIKKILFGLVLFLVLVSPVFAQDFNFTKAREDYVFSQDTYKLKLDTFNSKKDSYNKNPTLSLKEEARIALLDFLNSRNELIKSYLTMLRLKSLESEGLNIIEKQNVYSKIDPEVAWYSSRKTNYQTNDSIETLINKSKEEDEKYKNNTLPVIYYALSNISLGEVINSKNKHNDIYKNLRTDSENLVKLGRADASLFDRWFKDINGEIAKIELIEKQTRTEIEKIFSGETYERDSAYKKAIDTLSPVKSNLLKLNQFMGELETTIEAKR